MDDGRFDEVVKIAATAQTRRHVMRGLLGGGLGAALGLGAVGDGAAARCRRKSARCRRSAQCCSNRCRRGFCYPRER